MNIRYANGQILRAVLLSRTEKTMRVASEGCDDSLDFTRINGVWVSEDCEPVQAEFPWTRHQATREVIDADCVCPPGLAARLIHMLYAGSQEASSRAPLARDFPAPALQRVV